MRQRFATSRAAALAIMLAATVAGCTAARPPQPAMVAKTESGAFGYAETSLPGDRYRVIYESPRLRASNSPGERAAALANEKQKAYDLALWRAAQIAVTQGFAAFLVEQDSRDADVTVRQQRDYYRPYGAYPLFPYSFYHQRWYEPYEPYHGRVSAQSAARVTATLTVKLLKAPVEGSLDADETQARLARVYAGATYPPAN